MFFLLILPDGSSTGGTKEYLLVFFSLFEAVGHVESFGKKFVVLVTSWTT